MKQSETIKLSRAEMRRLARLTDRADKITDADARFFERFPARSHRFRQAAAVEIEVSHLLQRGQAPRLAGRRWYVVIKQIVPGVRLRAFTMGNPDMDEASEVAARAVWDVLVRPGTQAFEIEAAYRAAAAARAKQ